MSLKLSVSIPNVLWGYIQGDFYASDVCCLFFRIKKFYSFELVTVLIFFLHYFNFGIIGCYGQIFNSILKQQYVKYLKC